jgi:hypothetical protein
MVNLSARLIGRCGMSVTTKIRAEVPIGREAELIGYLARLAPGAEPRRTDRLDTGTCWIEVVVNRDVAGDIEAQVARMETNGIKITVHTVGSD